MSNKKQGFEVEYSDQGFWNKVRSGAKAAGKDVVEKALWLYYAAQAPATPTWARTVIYSALGYFIFPLDALPDLTPLIGYGDDLGVLAFAIATVAMHITDDIKAQAAQKARRWFGD